MSSDKDIIKTYSSDKLLRNSVYVLAITLLINIVCKIIMTMYAHVVIDVCFLICVLFLFRAFSHHNKNVQKGLLGAILMWYLADELNYVINDIVMNPSVFSQYDNMIGKTYIVLQIATFFFFVLIFINHFLLCGDHKSRPEDVVSALCLMYIILGLNAATTVFQFITFYPSVVDNIENISWHIMTSAYVIMILSYDSHFEVWKENREVSDNN